MMKQYKKHKFNVFPEMQDHELTRLRDDIVQNGYDTTQPIFLYQGKILDGWNRYKVCQELGIEPPTKEFKGDDAAALSAVWRMNNRRDLNSGQRACCAVLCRKFFEQVQQETELNRVKKQAETRKGKKYKQKYSSDKNLSNEKNEHINAVHTKIASAFNTNRTYIDQAKVLKIEDPDMFESVMRGSVSLSDAIKKRKNNKVERARKRLAEAGKAKSIDVDFRLGDFEEVFADIPDGSVDCIVTDPPYSKQYFDEWTKLSRFARRVLKPHGFCIAYSGQMYLPDVMTRMGQHLEYYWTFAVYHNGQTQIVNGVNLMCRWKPVLIYQNGRKKTISKPFQDYFVEDDRQKDGHDWQQGEAGVEYLVEMFTYPGQLVIDPFAGSGTTIRVCRAKGRIIMASEIDRETYNIAKAKL